MLDIGVNVIGVIGCYWRTHEQFFPLSLTLAVARQVSSCQPIPAQSFSRLHKIIAAPCVLSQLHDAFYGVERPTGEGLDCEGAGVSLFMINDSPVTDWHCQPFFSALSAPAQRSPGSRSA